MQLLESNTGSGMIKFIKSLILELENPGRDWENITLDHFLDGLVQSIQHRIDFAEISKSQHSITWEELAEIIVNAKSAE